MPGFFSRSIALLIPTLALTALTGCPNAETESVPPACDPAAENADQPQIVVGAPMAGVAEAWLELPAGAPLSGYTSRCGCFGGDGRVDRRDSNYSSEFKPSAGVQSPIPLKVFWFTNGDQDLVIVKMDLIYSFDGLVDNITERLSAATGRDLKGKVVVTTNHSHNAYGDFSDQITYYLGSDRFNQEVFERIGSQAEAVGLEAFDALQPVKLGVGYAKDWDPEDKVYHDRRGDNDDLQFFPDIPAGSYKDPNLTLLRIDTMEDEPLAVLFNFGIHGTGLDSDNAMVSGDAPGQVERAFEDQFDHPVVVALLQGGTGDASPSSSDGGYASLESTGEAAKDAILELWAATPTAADPIRLETVSRAVKETHDDIRITRGGTTDLHYTPFVDGLKPDNVVYNPDGSLIPEIDEFNAQYGAAFCGEDPAYLPGQAPADVFPYVNCVRVDTMVSLIKGWFTLTDEESALPITESTRAHVTASRMGPLPMRTADGQTISDDFFIGFLPGEPTAMYTEQFRRRAAAELGYEHSMAVGYSQDHEGYLLIPEDWLQGGYETDINIWGPLQAEHIMEQLLIMAGEELSTDKVEKHDPCGLYASNSYGAPTPLPTLAPDEAPEAGTRYDAAPDALYSPLYTQEERDAGMLPTLTVEDEAIPRVEGIVQMAWIGGDPGVDWPVVTLEKQAEDGSWSEVLTHAGRPISLGPDILLTTTPSPQAPATVYNEHHWYAAWQAVDHDANRTGVELGTYRLHVVGQTYTGGSTVWPWNAGDYELYSPVFHVTPATIRVSRTGTGDVQAWFQGPSRGYRLVGTDGYYQGANPLPGDTATVTCIAEDGSSTSASITGTHSGGVTTLPAADAGDACAQIVVTDSYGNEGGA
jgi:hypothetical protein